MSIVKEWAKVWNVPPAAIMDLERRLVMATQCEPDNTNPLNSENRVQSEIRLRAPHVGMLLFRNNVGALLNDKGRPVRYGLANDSKEMNERIKSADLIGIRKVPITLQMVGTVIGQFASAEAKKRDWVPGEDVKRETAQKAWATLIESWGGYAIITNDANRM